MGGRSETQDRAAEAGLPHAPGFMTAGITDPDTYYYRRVITDVARLLEMAAGHRLIDPNQIAVTGVSQGGGLALAAAGLAPALGITLVGAAPDVPFLCHFRRAVEVATADPYPEIARYLAGWRGHTDLAFHTLGYVDGVNFAKRARCPVLFSVALMDPICPPSTVYAAYHAFGGPDREIRVYPFNAHEGGEDHHVDVQLDWFASRFAR